MADEVKLGTFVLDDYISISRSEWEDLNHENQRFREALEKIAAPTGPHDKDWTDKDFKQRSEFYEQIAKQALTPDGEND